MIHRRLSCAWMVALLSTCATLSAAVEQRFELDTGTWKVQPKTVNLAGEFNSWNATGTPMSATTGKTWFVTVRLEEGTYHYKFVVDAGTPTQRWINDPKADKSLEVDDGNQGMNSGVVVGTDVAKLPPAKRGQINGDAIRFDPKDTSDFDVVDAKHARIRVRAQQGDADDAFVTMDELGGESQMPVRTNGELRRVGSERGLDVFAGIVDVPAIPKPARLNIVVREKDSKATSFATKGDQNFVTIDLTPSVNIPAWAADANWYQIFVDRFRNGDPSNDPGDFKAYERLVPWNGDWLSPLPGESPGMENFFHGDGNVWKRRLGGDLAGVREKLPYLRSLGINAIYFNPIFEAESMHKYDTADYRHVDDNFGVRDSTSRDREGANPQANPQTLPDGRGSSKSPLGNHEFYNRDGTPMPTGYAETEDPKTWRWTKSDLLFLDVLKDAHAQGFHVILDGVFNHVGRAHPFFQDVLKNGKSSAYADWFEITDWGDAKNWHELPDPYAVHGKKGGIQWRAWDGENGHLPALKKDAARGLATGPREHVLAIAKRWGDPDGDPTTHDGIDGWRLDAANEVPHPFWVDFRTAVRAANPDSYITGEIWSPAQAWVNNGKEFDAVMNYQFAMACQDFFVNVAKQTKPSEFNNRLVKLWFMYPQAAALAMQNLFDSHDTDRVASMFVNPDRPYDGQNRNQDNAKDHPYDERKPTDVEWARLLQMVAFQQMFIGAPMTYYGGEAGMWGSDDPNDRQPLPWDDKGPFAKGVGFNKTIFDGYQRYIAIRNALPALRTGTFFPIKVDDAANVYAFARELGEQRVYVALNRSDQTREITLDGLVDGPFVDYMAVKIAMPDASNPDQRPTPVVTNDTKTTTIKDGKLTVSLPAYGVAILASPASR